MRDDPGDEHFADAKVTSANAVWWLTAALHALAAATAALAHGITAHYATYRTSWLVATDHARRTAQIVQQTTSALGSYLHAHRGESEEQDE